MASDFSVIMQFSHREQLLFFRYGSNSMPLQKYLRTHNHKMLVFR
jgi:hypothetical protein